MTTHPYEVKEVLLKAENVTVAKGGRLILRDVDVEVRNIVRPGMEQGQVIGFLGPSGMGKTTLFRALSGLEKPQRGRVLVTEALAEVEPGMVGVVPQHYTLFEDRTVLGNLLVAARRFKKAEARDRSMDLLKRFKVDDRADAYPAELSGGQRQRVAIIQQLLSGHTYLLMDEPFSGLDPVAKAMACELVVELSQMGERNTIIVVTHDIREAVKVSDTLWLLGRERDDTGAIVPGARIVETYNLIEKGLAWRKDIERTPEFISFQHQIEDRFRTL